MNQFKVIFILAMLAAGAGIGSVFGGALESEGNALAAIVVGFAMFSALAGVVLVEAFAGALRWFKR
ncbi:MULTISPECIES: hypothetical protein [Achromobacter]|uniref:Uncharacterized protein n=1 Tax=Achromobacter aegrifaciens TaxID=1287736 RepID=A0AAD2KLZ7_ACHAE|nr:MULTISPECIES: hypothetical protein [Achromobacter]CAB3921099.1 hypothetical protein LMG26684_05711 [Achromobacter mucicolens]CUJ72270.1 Uncharacterised protein [Achromobacter aegrifaciens]